MDVSKTSRGKTLRIIYSAFLILLVAFTIFRIYKSLNRVWTTVTIDQNCSAYQHHYKLSEVLFVNAIRTSLQSFDPNSVMSAPEVLTNSDWIFYNVSSSDTAANELTREECAIALANGDSSVLENIKWKGSYHIRLSYFDNELRWITLMDTTGGALVAFRYRDIKYLLSDVCPQLKNEVTE